MGGRRDEFQVADDRLIRRPPRAFKPGSKVDIHVVNAPLSDSLKSPKKKTDEDLLLIDGDTSSGAQVG